MTYKDRAKEVSDILDNHGLPEAVKKQVCNIVQELELENRAYDIAFENSENRIYSSCAACDEIFPTNSFLPPLATSLIDNLS